MSVDPSGRPASRNDHVIRKVSRAFLLVSILTFLAATLGMLVDGIVIGNFLGGEALASANVASALFLLYAALAGVLAAGGTARCALHIGREEPGQVRYVFTVTLLAAVVLSALLTAAGILYHRPLAVFLGARGGLVEMTADYVLGISFGAGPIILTLVLMPLVRLDNSKNLPLCAIVTMTALNLALDLLVVLVLHLGMLGMALATSVSYAVAVLICGTHFLRRHNTLRLVPVRGFLTGLGKISLTGLPDAMTRFYSAIRTGSLNHLLMALGGVGAVTAFSLRSNAYFLLGPLSIGIGQAVVPVAGIFFGEEDRAALKDVLLNILKTGLLICAGTSLPLFALAGPFTALFGVRDAGTVESCIAAVRLFAVSMPFMLVNVTLMNFYQTTQNLLVAHVICAARSLLFVLGFSLLLMGLLGELAVWLAFVLAEVATVPVIAAMVRARSGRWPRSISDCMLLPPDFGGRPEDRLDISIGNSMREVIDLSRRVAKFCEGRGVDARRSTLVSLAVEEMAGNVVQHGFREGQEGTFDVRVLVKGERMMVRVRDDGRRFHPFEHLAAQDPGDLASNIGIRMIKALASQTDYRYSIGLNNLILWL